MANDNENISLTVNESQTSMTESKMMSEGVHSTPVTSKKTEDNEMIKMMKLLFNEQKSDIREIQSNLNIKLDEVKNEIRKQNVNFDR